MKRKVLLVILPLISFYCIYVALYFFPQIDFNYTSGGPALPGFSSEVNLKRMILGFPPTYYSGVGEPPYMLIPVILRVVIAVVLMVIWFKMLKKKEVN